MVAPANPRHHHHPAPNIPTLSPNVQSPAVDSRWLESTPERPVKRRRIMPPENPALPLPPSPSRGLNHTPTFSTLALLPDSAKAIRNPVFPDLNALIAAGISAPKPPRTPIGSSQSFSGSDSSVERQLTQTDDMDFDTSFADAVDFDDEIQGASGLDDSENLYTGEMNWADEHNEDLPRSRSQTPSQSSQSQYQERPSSNSVSSPQYPSQASISAHQDSPRSSSNPHTPLKTRKSRLVPSHIPIRLPENSITSRVVQGTRRRHVRPKGYLITVPVFRNGIAIPLANVFVCSSNPSALQKSKYQPVSRFMTSSMSSFHSPLQLAWGLAGVALWNFNGGIGADTHTRPGTIGAGTGRRPVEGMEEMYLRGEPSCWATESVMMGVCELGMEAGRLGVELEDGKINCSCTVSPSVLATLSIFLLCAHAVKPLADEDGGAPAAKSGKDGPRFSAPSRKNGCEGVGWDWTRNRKSGRETGATPDTECLDL
ncbi:hypothetical protein DFH09DRAFT_17615 [Mycena vulgaris]|nr:hypothetical protein DFH09DRAFT_17615 [Mycena vulgaris]